MGGSQFRHRYRRRALCSTLLVRLSAASVFAAASMLARGVTENIVGSHRGQRRLMASTSLCLQQNSVLGGCHSELARNLVVSAYARTVKRDPSFLLMGMTPHVQAA